MGSTFGDDDSAGPQEELNGFWEDFIAKKPSKVTNIFPSSLYTNLLPPQRTPGPAKGRNAAESYEAAAKECRARVKQIIRECHRTNEKYTDPEFDIESDLKDKNCLEGLMAWYDDPPPPKATVSPGRLSEALATLAESNLLHSPSRPLVVGLGDVARILDRREPPRGPESVHRIDWIFDEPSFTVDNFSSSDVKQGANGDCWFIAAVATICSNPSLMEKVCVMADADCQECGVYGFVFYRDGEWIWTVIDDNLYLRNPDFDAFGDDYDPTGIKERKYKRNNQTGSDALYFASCADQNETWLPLLEKAYAKAHGDYRAISGGISGEAVEDLTGGVTTKIITNRILSKDRLWKELLEVNKQFLFSASSPGSYGDARQGLALNHAHSVIKAVEEEDEQGNKHRLVLIRNPWGERLHAGMGEWNGPWADGSKEWTPYWMEKLDYRFDNDGLFWMSFDDFRKRFHVLHRTRLFDKEWTVVQSWASVSVAWVTGYLNTKFVVEIRKAGPTVFVLCQLDDRYFRGLEGKYSFDLHFVLQEGGAPAGEHIVRARGPWFGNRSISAEVDLEPGKYEVVPKIVASRDPEVPDVYEVVTKLADRNPQKLRQIGMNYDIAHAKGVVEVATDETKKKEEKKKAAEEKKRKDKEEAEKERAEFEAWKKEKREREEKEKAEKENFEKEAAERDKPETRPAETVKATSEDKTGDVKEDGSKLTSERPKEETTKETAALEMQQPLSNDKDGKVEEQPSNEPVPQPTDERVSSPTDLPPLDPFPVAKRSAAPHLAPRPPSAYDGSFAPGPPFPSAPPRPPAPQNPDNKWNAVCVLGLRVYSQDPEVSIKLVKPKDAEEGALLDVDGATQAGATMS